MKKVITLSLVLSAAFGLSACTANITTGNNAANNTANKPANAANNASNSANKANTTSSTNTKPKTEVKNEEKPKGDTKKQKNAPTVPAEWVYYADEQRGYGFSLPAGSESANDSTDGVDTFMAETPDKISVIVFAFKDNTLTKEDLLDRAEKAMNAMGETVTAGKLTGESEDYAVADADSTSTDGTKSKLKVLVATDVTDNYVMFVRSDVPSYEAKKATMDMIWGSFEMYSGGASGDN